ncbi:hypothetical protein [Paenibacillus sp. IHBB 10380]|uniref:hypothetical protein n=1 Tax=Paenibacillus sp. IHBB 10380 TaxID=1566358 RepID=UPI0005CFB059|nr:hypothetical protein [Paenibacillus sp. IHBB 10380]AJS57782.1 hypothetical protein UB51_03920 [Paenibacillus sp. IHBB 10380]
MYIFKYLTVLFYIIAVFGNYQLLRHKDLNRKKWIILGGPISTIILLFLNDKGQECDDKVLNFFIKITEGSKGIPNWKYLNKVVEDIKNEELEKKDKQKLQALINYELEAKRNALNVFIFSSTAAVSMFILILSISKPENETNIFEIVLTSLAALLPLLLIYSFILLSVVRATTRIKIVKEALEINESDLAS